MLVYTSRFNHFPSRYYGIDNLLAGSAVNPSERLTGVVDHSIRMEFSTCKYASRCPCYQ